MTYLLDTDTLSIWEAGRGPEYAIFSLNLSAHPASEIGASVVSFQEQALGCHKYLNNAKSAADLVKGYARWNRVIEVFRICPAVPFDTAAAVELARLRQARIRIGEMDLRIAATALAGNLTVVTRNVSDFARVPGLRTEDWSK